MFLPSSVRPCLEHIPTNCHMHVRKKHDMRSNVSFEMRDIAKKRSYGTLASEHQPLMQTRQTRHEKRLRISTGFLLRYKYYGGLGVCLLLICFIAWSGNYRASAGPPTRTPTEPSRNIHHNRQLPVYLWLVEHDPDAHDQALATLKSLYTADRFLSNTSDGTL